MNVASAAVLFLSALLVAQTIGLGVLWSRYVVTRAKAESAEEAGKTCEAANVGQTAARDRLREALRECTASIEARREAGLLALRERDAALAELDALQRQRSDQAEALYANDPDCGAMRRAPVCGALSERLHEAARNR